MRFVSAALIFAATCLVIGCSPEHSIKSVSLEMRAKDEFTLDGRTIKPGELKNALATLSKSGSKVCVAVSAAMSVSNDDMHALMNQVQSAGITCVGTVGVDK